MPHPKALAKKAAAPPTSLPPADAAFAQPAEDGMDDLMLAAPPASARGKKQGGPGKKQVEPPPPEPAEEEPLPLEAEPPEEEEEGEYYEEEEGLEDPGTQDIEEMEEAGEAAEPEADARSVASDEQNSEPPDVQVEVAQLQDMVNKCLKAALKGCPCSVLQNGERVSSRYFVDEALEKVTVASFNSPTKLEIVVPISGIQDIFCVPEDGEAAFPAEAMSMLQQMEKDLLLMVVFQGMQREYGKFCLLMDSKEGRDGFMEAMRVLCVASRFNAEQSSSSSGRQGGAVRSGPAPGGKPGGVALPAGGKAADSSAIPRQQVSVRFFMRSIGIKALQQNGPEHSKKCPLPQFTTDGVVPYISAFGYRPSDDMHWELLRADNAAAVRPTISLRVRQHFEAAKHTWYIVETTLRMDKTGNVQRLDWLAPRRLAHMRAHLHDRIKEILGDSYGRHFAGVNFAHRLGLPGTTAQLHRWVNALADVINSRRVPPLVVATVLNFLEAPNPAQGAVVSNTAEDLVPFQAIPAGLHGL